MRVKTVWKSKLTRLGKVLNHCLKYSWLLDKLLLLMFDLFSCRKKYYYLCLICSVVR